MVSFTAQDIYEAYPGAEMLPLPPPEPNESCADYKTRLGFDVLVNCGDTLFAFLISELADAGGNTADGLRMIDVVFRDVQKIQLKLYERYHQNDTVR
jgi:hypothetical protein